MVLGDTQGHTYYLSTPAIPHFTCRAVTTEPPARVLAQGASSPLGSSLCWGAMMDWDEPPEDPDDYDAMIDEQVAWQDELQVFAL